ATSALDNRSQARIQTVLNTHWKGKTTLIAVVHRLDIIQNFNKIGVLRSGKVEEMGSYDELMDKKGLLYELVGAKR
ncbi:MAG: ABC transporter permease, partial [Desulfobacterales bacterium]